MSATTITKCRLTGPRLGSGGYSHIYRAILEPSGVAVALKKSRASLRVRRTLLRHEARVLQLLQDHPAFPRLIGYARAPHFEYLAIELLGETVREKVQERAALNVATVVRIGLHMLSALAHLHSKGIVHRDIKPENVLLCPSDPSRVRVIDFGLSRSLHATSPQIPVRNPQAHNRHVFGTLHWCSLNAHAGIPLGQRDDLESLAYVLLFLHRGYLPWRRSPFTPYEPVLKAQARIRASKLAFAEAEPVKVPPVEIGRLLEYARSLNEGQAPDYERLVREWRELAERLGCSDEAVPLDWTPRSLPEGVQAFQGEASISEGDKEGAEEDDEDEVEDRDEDENEEYSNSYFALDIADWDDIQTERDKSLSFPVDQAELLDGSIPEISEIVEAWDDAAVAA